MLLRYFYDERLAHASYLVGCAKTGEALVVDPARDIAPYLAAAEQAGLCITHVTETHIHADFVSGSRELAAATGATIFLSDLGDANWQYQFADQPNVTLVRDQTRWLVGKIKVEVLHTPGHTPEHIAFLLTDTANADQPIGIFTGDALFVGDVGRPDLMEAVAGLAGTAVAGAQRQFETVQRFKAMPDYLQIWPAHGAGSACGKALGAIPSTTLGYEKRFNPAFQIDDAAAFAKWLLTDQPEAPRYFAQMKQVNKLGPALLAELPPLKALDRPALDDLIAGGALVVDLRSRADFVAGHIPGSVSVPERKDFSTFVGWLVDYTKPLYLIVPAAAAVPGVVNALRSIGVDQIGGYTLPAAISGRLAQLPEWSAQELAARLPQNGLVVLDVRNKSEYNSVRIKGARHIHIGSLLTRLDEIARDRTVVLHCASGYRSQIATSLLRSRGFDNVINLRDGVDRWSQAVAVERGE